MQNHLRIFSAFAHAVPPSLAHSLSGHPSRTPGPCGPARGHAVCEIHAPGVREKAAGRRQAHLQPSACVSDWSLRSPSGQCPLPTLNPLSLRSKSREVGGTKGKPSLTINIRQLFQNILDLVFIVEHTYQGKVLHTHNYKSFLGKKL